MILNANEQAMVRAILVAARVKDSDIDWMVESCPSVERTRELYSRGYRAPRETPERPAGFYDGVKQAADRLHYAKREGDDEKETEAFSQLQTELAIVYWQIEQLEAGIEIPPLSAETKRNIDALDGAA